MLIDKAKIVAIIFLLLALAGASQNSADSLKMLLEQPMDDTVRFRTLMDLSKAVFEKDREAGLRYSDEALRFAEEKGIKPEVKYLDFVIYLNDLSGRYDRSVEYLERKIKLLYPPKNILEKILLLKSEGYLYFREGRMSKSLELFTEAQSMAEKEGMEDEVTLLYYDIARVYERLQDYDKEKECYELYLTHVDWEAKLPYVTRVLQRIAVIELEREKYEEANHLLDQALELTNKTHDSSQMAMVLNHMAWVAYLQGDLEKSLKIYHENIRLAEAINGLYFLGNCYGNIGNIYRDWKDYDKAIEYYQKSIEVAKKTKDYYNLSWLHEDISKMYIDRDDYKNAYNYFVLHARYADSMMTNQYNQRLFEARNSYEADKKAREFELLEIKLRQNRYLMYGLSGGLALLLVIGGLIFYQSRIISKQRIAEMNHRLSELNQRNLRQQMNPHFIFNTLNSIQYYVFQNDKIAANDYMTKFAKLIRMTLDNSRHTSIPIRDEIESLRLYLELETIRFKGKFQWQINVDEEIDTLLYRIPTMLIQPFVENSIVHGLMNKENGKGYVGIDLKLFDEHILCTIEDNGIGRDMAMKIKNEKKKEHNSLGTRITESRLNLVNTLYGKNMKINYTDLKDPDGRAAGTRVEISIPLVG